MKGKALMTEESMNDLSSTIEERIPFLKDMGIKILGMDTGQVKLMMEFTPHNKNHIGTSHAGAIFTFGETCGGVAVRTAIDISKYYFVVKDSQIKYLKPVTETIYSEANIPEDIQEKMREELEKNGKATCFLSLTLYNEKGETVAEMNLTYVVKKR